MQRACCTPDRTRCIAILDRWVTSTENNVWDPCSGLSKLFSSPFAQFFDPQFIDLPKVIEGTLSSPAGCQVGRWPHGAGTRRDLRIAFGVLHLLDAAEQTAGGRDTISINHCLGPSGWWENSQDTGTTPSPIYELGRNRGWLIGDFHELSWCCRCKSVWCWCRSSFNALRAYPSLWSSALVEHVSLWAEPCSGAWHREHLGRSIPSRPWRQFSSGLRTPDSIRSRRFGPRIYLELCWFLFCSSLACCLAENCRWLEERLGCCLEVLTWVLHPL